MSKMRKKMSQTRKKNVVEEERDDAEKKCQR